MPKHRAFKIPVKPTGCVVFVPDERKVFLVGDATMLPDEFASETPLPSFTRLPDYTFRAGHLIVNNFCNLRCVYCYANAGDLERLVMPVPIMRAAIDKLVSDTVAIKQSVFELGFIGGEPTLSLPLIREGVTYARAEAAKAGISARIGIVTNGYYPDSIGRYIREKLDYATMSIDGPKEVHDRQRPTLSGKGSFDRVYLNARYLYDAGFPFGVRCTVSRESVSLLPEIVLFLHDAFPNSVIGLEPLQECGRCALTKACGPVPDEYAEKMVEVMRLALTQNIRLKSSVLRFKIQQSDISFCGVNGQNFAITPEGDVSACTRVTSRQDASSAIFHFGRYNTELGSFEFDREKFQWLKTLVVDSNTACNDCFARFNCKGDCAAIKADVFGAELATEQSTRCAAIQRMTKALFCLQVGLDPAVSV